MNDELIKCAVCEEEFKPGYEVELLEHFERAHPEEWIKRCVRAAQSKTPEGQ